MCTLNLYWFRVFSLDGILHVTMKVSVVSLIPEVTEPYMGTSMMKKARDNDLLELELINLRDFGVGPRQQVDDTPYGGGDGMVLRADVVVPAIEYARSHGQRPQKTADKVILMTPRGKTFNQAKAKELSKLEHLIIVCGRYEGIDDRVGDYIDEDVSVGDFVLTGGELPAMMVIDATIRLIPGVLGGECSTADESFSDGKTLEHPHYTRPEVYRGVAVPEVLRTGNHAEIEKWRREHSSEKT